MTAETDPNGKAVHEHGSKLDAGKAPMWRGLFSYFPNALEAVSLVSQKGAEKYTWGGWKTVPDGVNRYTDALVRHLKSEATDETYDPDGLLHAAQVAWNALARLELSLQASAFPNMSEQPVIQDLQDRYRRRCQGPDQNERRSSDRRVDRSIADNTPVRRLIHVPGRRSTD